MRYTYSRGVSKVQVTKTERQKLSDARDLLFALSKHSSVASSALGSLNNVVGSISEDGTVMGGDVLSLAKTEEVAK